MKTVSAVYQIIQDAVYSDTLHVSPELHVELILGRPWWRRHRVIHDHVVDCFFVGSTGRQRVYVNPLPHAYELAASMREIDVQSDFPPELKHQFMNLIRLQASLFYGGRRLKQTLANVQHEIHLNDGHPFWEPPCRYSDEKRQYIDTQVREMLRDGIIEPTSAPFSSTIVIAEKKDGDYRFCSD